MGFCLLAKICSDTSTAAQPLLPAVEPVDLHLPPSLPAAAVGGRVLLAVDLTLKVANSCVTYLPYTTRTVVAQ